MGDNGPFMEYVGPSGQSDRIYRGGKTEHLEGGVRVNAYVRWPGVIEANSRAKDITHVSDLFTTFARIADADDGIPRDRIIDGVDQTALWFMGEGHGRRDYVFVYEGFVLKVHCEAAVQDTPAAPGRKPDPCRFVRSVQKPSRRSAAGFNPVCRRIRRQLQSDGPEASGNERDLSRSPTRAWRPLRRDRESPPGNTGAG